MKDFFLKSILVFFFVILALNIIKINDLTPRIEIILKSNK